MKSTKKTMLILISSFMLILFPLFYFNHSFLFVVTNPGVFITNGPTVNMVTPNSTIIHWRTNELSNSTVEYGLNTSLIEEINSSELVITHSIKLVNLKENTTYYYRVKSNNTCSDIYTFKTAFIGNGTFTFLVWGDNRPFGSNPQPQVFKELVNLMFEQKPNLVFGVGDYIYGEALTEETTRQRWCDFTNETDKLHHTIPLFLAVGNHDIPGKTYFEEYFYAPYNNTNRFYSFDYGNSHFVILNSEELGYEGRLSPAQKNWLESDLNSTNKVHRFIFMHRPMYPVNSHLGDSFDRDPALQNWMQELFENYSVDIVFAGHEHLYARQNASGITNLIVGGGGAPLHTAIHTWGFSTEINISVNHFVKIEVSNDTITGWCITNQNTTVDTFSFTKSKSTVSQNKSNLRIDLYQITPKNPTAKDSLIIRANITSNFNITTVQLFYRIKGSNTWLYSYMRVENNSTYISDIIGPFPAGTVIEYFIRATDSSSNSINSELFSITISKSLAQNSFSLILFIVISIGTVFTLISAVYVFKKLKI
ncbi:MAG: metallophosphoesterase [Candidatus Odinarchaeia archaeon]